MSFISVCCIYTRIQASHHRSRLYRVDLLRKIITLACKHVVRTSSAAAKQDPHEGGSAASNSVGLALAGAAAVAAGAVCAPSEGGDGVVNVSIHCSILI